MGKKLVFLVMFCVFYAHSQTKVLGNLVGGDIDYNWGILYQLKGANQIYIANTEIVKGTFSVEIPSNSPSGMYRFTYDLDNNGYVDFIANNETISLEFNPNKPLETLVFLNSEENKNYSSYMHESESIKQKLDSIQINYLAVKRTEEKKIISELYQKVKNHYDEIQKHYEKRTTNLLANHFIKANYKFYPQELNATPQLYLNSVKEHYFDFINFNDKVLLNSTFFTEKIIDYVFYLNSSDDPDVKNKLQIAATNTIIEKTGNNIELKSELLTTLLYAFAQTENAPMVYTILNDYYKNMPVEYQDEKVIKVVTDQVKTVFGAVAPDFSWFEKGKNQKLSTLSNSEKYVLVFYSSTCSHCLIDVPKLYYFTQKLTKVKVIAVALEDDDVQFKIHASKFKDWSNVLALGKWENSIAKAYGIKSTPTYLILNAEKKIIAKPYSLVDIFTFFQN